MNKRITAKPVIWIIDGQQWPRAYLRAELIERGLEAIGFVELTEAVAALYDPEYVTPHLIVLELQGQSITKGDLDTLTRFGISTVALGGAAEMDQPLVKEFNWRALTRRPFTIGEIADAVEDLAGRSELSS